MPAPSTSPPAAKTASLGDPKNIAGCLASLGFKTGELQRVQVKTTLWQASSSKLLADGDVSLCVSGPSATTTRSVELETYASVAGIAAARSELLRALSVLLKHLKLSMPAELAPVIEASNDAGIAETEVEVNGVKIHCVARSIGDQRSVCVRLTHTER